MNENSKIIKNIQAENVAWIIYIVLILLSLYSNYLEKNYYLYNDIKAKEDYRKLNIFIFSVAFIVYFYFFKGSLEDFLNLGNDKNSRKYYFNEINLIASSLILIAGALLVYIAIFDTELDAEIALT